ncbi:bacterio-opsin activator domain-containing protein [Saliphagus infecundisoli]|uniref:Bacterio-opsin activator domain-containing protein n=1 Tax=Saliphagus infecundisoli TaxID=1849069 RepID=A0ABD5QA34_9EURY|nr:bacterio-opsin activator domain-containing protein [Saliphagus infecundisoli]
MASHGDELARTEYEALLDAAESYREALVVRLVGETGLRPRELTRIRPDNVHEQRSDPPRYLLSIPTESGGEDRRAYLPTAVEGELRRYVRNAGIAGDERVFSVGARRLQMLVSEVADRAATRRSDPSLAGISTDGLRRFFARRTLVAGVNPRAVKAAGGWGSFQSLEPYLPEPTDDALVAAFDPVEPDRIDRSDGTTASPPGIPGRHRAVTEAILESSTPAEIEAELCETLAGSDLGDDSVAGPPAYDLAWIERRTPEDGESPHAACGIDADRTADLPGSFEGSREERPGEVAVVEADGVDRSPESVAAVGVGYGDATYATLFVGADREGAFGTDERGWLSTVGRQAGHAVAAARRRTLLLSDTLVELEIVCRDGNSFFVSASAQLGCRFELDSLVSLTEATQLCYVRLEGAPPTDVFDLADADPGVDDCRLVGTGDEEWRVEFVLLGSSPIVTLTEYGTTVLAATIEEGVARIAAECSADAEIRAIVEGVRSAFPDSELAGKREVERSVRTASEFREGIEQRLTDRQEAALRAAYFGGYYDWPRESTAEEIADAMGISSPTLHNHLRKGQHELLRTFFDGPSTDETR